jgi:uncharacterized protein (TIGR02186 family)
MRAKRSLWGFIAALLLAAMPANAADLVSGLSTDLIQITSNFTGADIVLFGAIEPVEDLGPSGDQDLVVVIRGPALDMTVRRKERILGIWVNREQVAFTGLPGYYFLASTRPLDDIASVPTQERFRLGTANLQYVTGPGIDPVEANAFRAAAIRDRKRERLYWESPTGIEFLSRTLFRARIPVPASVPSLFHSSTPCSPSSAAKKTVAFVCRRYIVQTHTAVDGDSMSSETRVSGCESRLKPALRSCSKTLASAGVFQSLIFCALKSSN